MVLWQAKSQKWCRWCGATYRAHKPTGKDGFCSSAHKQAHYRAYKHYVTAVAWLIKTPAAVSVTLKKPKK